MVDSFVYSQPVKIYFGAESFKNLGAILATEAGETGKRQGSLQKSRSDSSGGESTELRAEDASLLAVGLVPVLLPDLSLYVC